MSCLTLCWAYVCPAAGRGAVGPQIRPAQPDGARAGPPAVLVRRDRSTESELSGSFGRGPLGKGVEMLETVTFFTFLFLFLPGSGGFCSSWASPIRLAAYNQVKRSADVDSFIRACTSYCWVTTGQRSLSRAPSHQQRRTPARDKCPARTWMVLARECWAGVRSAG